MRDAVLIKIRLKKLGADKSRWGQPERKELPRILMEDEEIQHIIDGKYGGGFATLCATNHRLLLIDKKVFFLTVEDIRYDMIAEVDYGHQFIGATIHVRSFSKDLKFQAFKKEKLRDLSHFIQHRVMALRGHQTGDINFVNNDIISKQPLIPSTQVRNSSLDKSYNLDVNADGITNSLSEEQITAVLPLDKEIWHKVSSARRLVNPYAQTPLTTRKRIGRFNFASR